MKSTTLNLKKKKLTSERHFPDGVGIYLKRVDAALLGQHTRQLYENRPWIERNILTQLRIDMSRFNNSLYRINAAPSRQCACGHEPETVAHFLFQCTRWDAYRTEMYQCSETKRGNSSFFLGGKAPSDGPDWMLNLKAV